METFSRRYLSSLPVKQTADSNLPSLRSVATRFQPEIMRLGIPGNSTFSDWRQAASKDSLIDAIMRAQGGDTETGTGETIPMERAREERSDLSAELEALRKLREIVGGGSVKRDEVERIVRETVGETLAPAIGEAIRSGQVPTPVIEIRIGELPVIKVEGHRHPQFQRILTAAEICRRSGRGGVYVFGPAGTGKTTVAEQVSEALGLRFGCISVTAGLAEGHVLGKMLFDGRFVGTSFLDCYENGGVFLFDEVDAADANMLLAINSAIANSFMSVPNRPESPIARRHRDFIALCAANTAGTGSDGMYSGRSPLDAATLDRFVGAVIPMGYDEALERGILRSVGLDAWEKPLRAIRKNIAERRVCRMLSTRFFQKLAVHYGAGDPDFATVERALARLMASWSEPEILKAIDGTSVSRDEVIKYRDAFASGAAM